SLGLLGGKIYGAAVTAANGSELWVTDGTAAGTQMVKDIEPGADSSSPRDFFLYNNSLYFFAKTTAAGVELWKTNGTNAGTVMVKDINPGVGNSVEDFTSFFASN